MPESTMSLSFIRGLSAQQIKDVYHYFLSNHREPMTDEEIKEELASFTDLTYYWGYANIIVKNLLKDYDEQR